METTTTEAQTRSTRLLADCCAPENAALFACSVLDEWAMPELAPRASAAVSTLTEWTRSHGAHVQIEVTLVWDASMKLLFTEVADHSRLIPDNRVLALTASDDYGAEDTDRGRCLWASFETGRAEASPETVA